MTPWLFGIDGGGTSTRLRIESLSGAPLFETEGGSGNLNSSPAAAVAAGLAALFDAAYSSGAGLDPGDCAAGHAGFAGAGRRPEREALASMLRAASRAACPISVGDDAEAALVGALGDTEGLLLVAGTGSIAYGRARDGTTVRAGGMGHLLGDEGSAYWVAHTAISRALRSAEGRDLPTTLLDDAVSHFGLEGPDGLIPLFYRAFDKARVAGFAPAVCRARDAGDELARAVLDEAAAELALLVASVHGRIGPMLTRPRLALAGGLSRGDPALAAALAARLRAAIPGLEIVEPAAGAAAGACALARSRAAARGRA
jgi:glucosamine kinase